MRRLFGLAVLGLSAFSSVLHAADSVILSYALPKTRVAAGVSQRITRCPPSIAQRKKNATYDITFNYTVLIEAKSVPARLVTIDPRSGFLVDRTTKMTFNEDGLTLKEYNATATGQGGPLIVSLIKAAAAVYGMTASPLAFAAAAAPTTIGRFSFLDRRPRAPAKVVRYFLTCRASVVSDLERLDKVRLDITDLESFHSPQSTAQHF